MITLVKLAEKYASMCWDKDEEGYERTFSEGDLWCNSHNDYLQGEKDILALDIEEIIKLKEELTNYKLNKEIDAN